MWEFIRDNWTGMLFGLAVFACPLMHAFGHRHHHGGRTRRNAQGG